MTEKQTTFWNAAATPALLSRLARADFTRHEAGAQMRIIVDVSRGMVSGRFGATCDEIEANTGMLHQTVSPCLLAMSSGDAPILRLTGAQRLTRSGNKAMVYEIITTEYTRDEADPC